MKGHDEGLHGGTARLVLVAGVALLLTLAVPASPAAAETWDPGEQIGTANGAERWCTPPNPCPPPSGARFNLDLTNWFPWANTSPGGGGGIGSGLAQFNYDGSLGDVDNLGVGVWCMPTPVIVFNWVFWVTFFEIKEVGTDNLPPPNAQDSDISFTCNALYIDTPNSRYPTLIVRIDRVKWWVHKKTPASTTDRGWIYLDHSAGRTIRRMKVQVTGVEYSRSLDICTPNSNPDNCDPLASAANTGPGPADLAKLSKWYKGQFPAASPLR